MRKHYRKRRQEIVRTLQELFGSATSVLGSASGLRSPVISTMAATEKLGEQFFV
jgi:hypothetical protein